MHIIAIPVDGPSERRNSSPNVAAIGRGEANGGISSFREPNPILRRVDHDEVPVIVSISCRARLISYELCIAQERLIFLNCNVSNRGAVISTGIVSVERYVGNPCITIRVVQLKPDPPFCGELAISFCILVWDAE